MRVTVSLGRGDQTSDNAAQAWGVQTKLALRLVSPVSAFTLTPMLLLMPASVLPLSLAQRFFTSRNLSYPGFPQPSPNQASEALLRMCSVFFNSLYEK